MTTVRRDDRATTAQRSVGLGLVEILSWMRHCHTVYEELGSKLRLTRALSSCDDHTVYEELGSKLRLTRALSSCDDHTVYEELGSKLRLRD